MQWITQIFTLGLLSSTPQLAIWVGDHHFYPPPAFISAWSFFSAGDAKNRDLPALVDKLKNKHGTDKAIQQAQLALYQQNK